jgi:hypothetical protein
METEKMKKIFFCCFVTALLSLSVSAQVIEKKTTPKKTKVETPHTTPKIKKTSTPTQKVHNIIHPKKKHYSGTKVKHEVKKN